MRSDRKRLPSAQEPQREGGWEELCSHRGGSAAASRKAAVNTFFFLGDVVLKEEPLRDARMERLRWVWGGKCCYFGKIPLPCGRTLCSTSPVRESEPLPGARPGSGPLPAARPSHECPSAAPRSKLAPRPAGQCPKHVPDGNHSWIHSPTTCLEGSRVPVLTGSLASRLQASCSRSHSAPTKQPPSCHWEAQQP